MKTFDKYIIRTITAMPLCGQWLARHYRKTVWMQELARFVVQTFVVFWLIKSPLIYLFTALLPPLNLLLFQIPSYLLAAFIVGVAVTLIGFVINKVWVFHRD